MVKKKREHTLYTGEVVSFLLSAGKSTVPDRRPGALSPAKLPQNMDGLIWGGFA